MTEDFMKERPEKAIFPKEKQKKVFEQVKEFVLQNLPGNTKLYKARIFGSIAKETFGKYKGKWKERNYSDVDVLFVVDDDFEGSKKWKEHFVPETGVWVVYDIAQIPVDTDDEKFNVDLQYIIIPRTNAKKKQVIELAEKWGIPLKRFFSKHKFIKLRLK